MTKYKLTDLAQNQVSQSISNNIDHYIDQYITEFDTPPEIDCKDTIHKYIYDLTTTNINSYRVLLSGEKDHSFTDADISVNSSELSDAERKLVHDFVKWENRDKNEALTNLVYCCLEYCLLVNGDKINPLVRNAIRKRTVFLDTNIIFRALGINGLSRKKLILSFLSKCNKAGFKLVILHVTKKEFLNTIDYYISMLASYPRGNVFQGAYQVISDENIFSFYESWKDTHSQLSLTYFRKYIISQYDTICKEYHIADNQLIEPRIFNSESFIQNTNFYASRIKSIKQQNRDYYRPEDYDYSSRDSHDATMIAHIESLRSKEDEECDIFLASSDKILRFWDMTREGDGYPIVVYPSQLFLILIKLCGRSENDYDSFVSFINIHPKSHQLSAEKANIIISGISSITEDIETQKILVESVYGPEFQSIISSSDSNDDLYSKIQAHTQSICDLKLKEKDDTIKHLEQQIEEKDTQKETDDSIMSAQREAILSLNSELQQSEQAHIEKDNQITAKDNELKEKDDTTADKNEKIRKYVEKRINKPFVMKWCIFPCISVVLLLVYVLFVVFQFTFTTASWNPSIFIIDHLSDSYFATHVDNWIPIMDGALFLFLTGIIIKAFWVNPFDYEKKNLDKEKRISNYIKKHKLD